MADQELLGKIALVTGAGRLRGIGRAAGVALAELGCDVVVTGTGRNPATFPPDEQAMGWRDIESTAEQIRALGRRCLTQVGDVSDSRDVQRMVDAALREFGHIDILVNNAAAARGDDRVPVVQIGEDLFRRTFEVKVMGIFLCSRAVARHFIERGGGGAIVNVSSVAGKRGAANAAAYSASNAAAESLTRSLARELASYQVNVNCVCPGLTETSRMDDLGREDRWRESEARIPLGRAAADKEVGEFIAWLCTRQACYITGQCINFDGGSLMER